jgi:very-short-patch-repair endonuclease
MDALDYLKSLGGVARTGTMLQAGYSPRDMRMLKAAGARQVRRGVVALEDCNRAYLSAIEHNARLTCASAAGAYGLWLRNPPLLHHVACNHGHGGPLLRHRSIRFAPHPQLPVAGLEDVVLHAMACLHPPASTAMAAAAMRLHGVPPALLAAELTAPRSAPALRALNAVDPRAESLVEVEALHLFDDLGLQVELQVQLDGIGRVDFLIEGFLIVEIDGFAFHSSRRNMRRDLLRNNASALSGYAVLRYMPEHIWNEPGRVIREIKAVLSGRIIR